MTWRVSLTPSRAARASCGRAFTLALSLALSLAFAAPADAQPNPVTTDQAGVRRTLREVLGGEVTVLHFMYPTCQNFCPLSGALLAETQRSMAARRAVRYQILSVAIVPSEATPARLTAWLRKHGGRPGWAAVQVPQRDLGALMRYYGETELDVQLHSSQMLVLDRRGRIARRFDEIPTVAQLSQALVRASALR